MQSNPDVAILHRWDKSRPTSPGMRSDHMNKRYTKPLSPEELAAMPDAAVDISDIAPPDAAFWQNARVVMPGGNRQVTLRLDAEVLDRFKAGGPGGPTRINAVLRAYVEARREG